MMDDLCKPPPTLATYLTQFSTYSGLIKLACALGLFAVPADAQDQLATVSVQFVTALLALTGAIDVLRNEKKGSNIPDNHAEQK